MEATWVEHLVSLASRIHRNDPTLIHLDPSFVADEQPSQEQQQHAAQSAATAAATSDPHNNDLAVASLPSPRITTTHNNNTSMSHSTVWSVASQFHMMMLLDEPSVQAALEDLWRACRRTTTATRSDTILPPPNNSMMSPIRIVTLPAIWPSPDLGQAMLAIVSLSRLEAVYVVLKQQPHHQHEFLQESDSSFFHFDEEAIVEVVAETQTMSDPVVDTDDEDEIVAERRGVWHASPLVLRTEILPLLEAAAARMEQQQQQHGEGRGELEQQQHYHGLCHLHVDCRLTVRTQRDIDDLGRVLARNTCLQTLSLHLVPKATETTLVLDSVLQAAADLSHPPPNVPGLRRLILKWGGEQLSPDRPAFSTRTMARLLASRSPENDDRDISTTTPNRPTTLISLRLENCLLADDHLMVVAEALQTNTTLRKLRLFGHTSPENGGVSLNGLKAVRDVLESTNYSLQKISLFTPQEDSPSRVHSATRRLVAVIRQTLDGYRYGAEDEHEEYYRTQHEMEIYCRLNRLGRGTLVSPETTIHDWIETLAKCCNSGSSTATGQSAAASSSANTRLDLRRSDGSIDVGLNEIYLLLRTHPSLCHLDRNVKRPSRKQMQVPKELLPTPGHIPVEGNNIFKTLVAPPTTVSQAFAMQLRQPGRTPSPDDPHRTHNDR